MVILRKGYGPNWRRAKRKALKRDGHLCVKCGSSLKVSVHHKRKIAWFVDSRTGEVDYKEANKLSNLETLCTRCHKVADGHAERQGFTRIK